MGLIDGFEIRIALGVLGECPVQLATEGACSLRLPAGMIRPCWICSTDSSTARRRSTVLWANVRRPVSCRCSTWLVGHQIL